MHRFRLFACLAVMLLMLGAGAWARFWWGVPERPYGWRVIVYQLSGQDFLAPRTPNPLEDIEWAIRARRP